MILYLYLKNNNHNFVIMKTKAKKERQVKVSESTLLSLVANKLKDKVLFPENIESAKEYLTNIQDNNLKFS